MPTEEPSPVDGLAGGGVASPDPKNGKLMEMGNLTEFLGEPLILLEKEHAVAEILQLELDGVGELEMAVAQIDEELPSVQYQRRATRHATVLSEKENLTFQTQGAVGTRKRRPWRPTTTPAQQA